MFRKISNEKLNHPFKLGVLKGGQLGRMLVQASMNYDLQAWVMDKDYSAPCRSFCSQFMIGDSSRFEDVYHFGKKVDMLTLEAEDIHVGALEQLEKEGCLVFPQASVVKLIQDKGLQKLFYIEKGIPTADFIFFEKNYPKEKYKDFMPAVQKLRRTGYDGKGIKMIQDVDELELTCNAPSFLEKKIDFDKEISVVVARNHRGEHAVYPPVELVSDRQKHLLDFLVAPAEISLSGQKRVSTLAVSIIEALGMVGLLAVEMFLSKDEEIYINEISPRPHNSGHHTIEANTTSQFDQHLRAILDLPLGDTAIRSPAVMVNLLGENGFQGAPVYEGIEKILSMKGVYVHLYGKSQTVPFRKMGHVTILDDNLFKAKETARWVKETVRVIA